MRAEGQAGVVAVNDGSIQTLRLARDGALVATEGHGPYFEAATRGALFIGSTPAAGVTVPIFSNLTQQFGLLNPGGSGVQAVLRRMTVGYVSGTQVAGHMCYAYKPNIGIGEADPATVTILASQNALLGLGQPSKCRIYSPVTLAVAATYIGPVGVSQAVQAATATNAPWTIVDDIQGGIIVPENTMFFVACNVAAGQGVVAVSLSWEEVPA